MVFVLLGSRRSGLFLLLLRATPFVILLVAVAVVIRLQTSLEDGLDEGADIHWRLTGVDN